MKGNTCYNRKYEFSAFSTRIRITDFVSHWWVGLYRSVGYWDTKDYKEAVSVKRYTYYNSSMKFFHTALSVKNIQESQKFFEEVFDFHFKIQGERPNIGVKFVMLEDNSGSKIELFEHKSPKELTENLMDFQQIGFKHIAFIVDNLEEVFNKALHHGAKVIWPIQKGVTVKRLAFISDPNGIPIELDEL